MLRFATVSLVLVATIAAQLSPASLTIVIIEGEGAINNIKQRVVREPVVQIQDEAGRPVAGATVVFTLPDTGPAGTFTGGSRSLAVITDKNGRAAAFGMRPNNVEGRFHIRVTATAGELSAIAAIEQVNVLAAAGSGAAGGPSWIRRLTGWTSLVKGKRETAGYGLYSYLLFAAPPNDSMRPRYAEAIRFFLTQIPGIESFSDHRRAAQLNVGYLLLRSEPSPGMSVEWVLDNYDYARAQVLLSSLSGSHPDGPYIISTVGPLSSVKSLNAEYLYQDLSSVPPRLIPLWLREFTEQAAQERFWERRTGAQFVLRLRTNIARVSEVPAEQLGSMIAWIDASRLRSPGSAAK